jgi:2-polyprenyl-3-methyl-5-hydroxy-6-metoxy-1,4-benzoquinol methylase
MSKKCPLCGNEHTKLVETLTKQNVVNVYKQEYDVDVSGDIKQDFSLHHCMNCDLKFFDPCFTGSQKFYTDLQKFDWYYKDDKYEYDHVSSLIKRGDSVLEIGCGKGAFKDRIKSKNYVGLEFSESAVQQAAVLGRDVRAQSIEEHAEQNLEKYDVVCSFQVIEHTSNPRSFLESALKSLKPGGTLILTAPSEDSFLQYIQDFALNMPPHHVTKWTDQCLTNLAQEFNIKCVHLAHEPLNSFHIRWYFTSMVTHQLNKTLGISHSLVKQKRHWFTTIVSNLLYKLLGNNLPKSYQGHGHTVIAVYKK